MTGWVAAFFGSILLSAFAAQGVPIDPRATEETRALFHNLKKVPGDQFLFGHHHSTAYGVGWKNDENRSDVKDVTGSFPAVYGWDRGHAGTDRNEKLIIEAFQRGGINTISWHMQNLSTLKNSWDATPGSVADVLPGGKYHWRLVEQLDGFAHFAKSLRDRRGRQVPIIFRPWHEHTGGWFWWGGNSCTPEEFIALWRFTVEHLRDERKVNNLLWAYSPSHKGIGSEQDYETNRFPGYDYIDVLGIDVYSKDNTDEMIRLCAVVAKLAKENGKIAALTEFGYAEGLNNCRIKDWYTAKFLRPLKNDRHAGGIAYVMTWRNDNPDHFWVPYPGHPAEEDFRKFFNDPMTVFENDLPDMYSF